MGINGSISLDKKVKFIDTENGLRIYSKVEPNGCIWMSHNLGEIFLTDFGN